MRGLDLEAASARGRVPTRNRLITGREGSSPRPADRLGSRYDRLTARGSTLWTGARGFTSRGVSFGDAEALRSLGSWFSRYFRVQKLVQKQPRNSLRGLRVLTGHEISVYANIRLPVAGDNILFDLNGLALFKGGAPECFRLAACEEDSEELAPGELLETGLPFVRYAREIVGLRIKPLYHVPAKDL
jgi:hypothetical protein